MTKVFCIGFHKTGTTSMYSALRLLGYNVSGPKGIHRQDLAENLGPITAELSYKYDAFQDDPWPLVYREMDALHPGSKFILTMRDEDGWFDSLRNHVAGRPRLSTNMQLVYGTEALPTDSNAEVFKGRMRRHCAEVRAYFMDRPHDLLELSAYDWRPICAFLGHPVPDVPFPHSNRRKMEWLPTWAREPLKRFRFGMQQAVRAH